MLRVFAADDHHDAIAPNDLAAVAARLHRRSNFHVYRLFRAAASVADGIHYLYLPLSYITAAAP